MQHAAEISAGDVADSKIERAKKQRDYFLQQTSAGSYVISSVVRKTVIFIKNQ